ncbi:MAG: tRNA 2-thiouridine(34) synthase MnmA [Kiritimatiellae bacterium]|nr:tRNA 2-thiouridine(34) synthase MnmA [Kiritimatiellia bacterium]
MTRAPSVKTEKLTVAVGMSGGVDSAVTVLLLKERGCEVIGLTMSIWDATLPDTVSKKSGCFGPGEADDIAAAHETAERLGIEHFTIPLAREYRQWVLDEFTDRRLAGYTPNPCAVCNPVMKFGFLLSHARERGICFDRFATGHYARVVRDEVAGLYRLLRGVDTTKDQSYFLARLKQAQLAELIFPLGEKTKSEVRELACRAGLEKLAGKSESQDFFEGEDISVLFKPGSAVPGPIIDESGKVLGQHRGMIHYTVGQREGLGIAVGHKVYVKEIIAEKNTLVVAGRDGVFSSRCRLSDMRWVAGAEPDLGRDFTVRLRYRHPGVAAVLEPLGERRFAACFAVPQFAVTPGQMAVVYDGEEVLGAGMIEKTL